MRHHLRALIDAKCKQCIYDPSNGGFWRQQIAACTVVSCPLWPVRSKSYARKGPEIGHNDAAIETSEVLSTLDSPKAENAL